MKKKVGILTFHAAHNYGSNLQSYALQKTVSDLGVDCEIINFRTERQKDQYSPLTKRKGIKYLLKNGYFLLNYKKRKEKYDKFESFICNYLVKSEKEYSSLGMLETTRLEYDYYISGSDQIWNTVPRDADNAYFLPFVKTGKKIAYAPSFGQFSNIKLTKDIQQYIKDYDYISVREKYGQTLVGSITGEEPPVMPDPTLLLSVDEWDTLAEKPILNEDYLFFYTLFASPQVIKVVKEISKRLNLKVVISNVSNQYEIFSGFKKITTAGPREFLSLIKHAKFICVTSFHGAVFSILFNKPFFAINGMKDNRVATLLQLTDLTDRAITIDEIEEKVKKAYHTTFDVAHENIQKMKKEAITYLKTSLDLEE